MVEDLIAKKNLRSPKSKDGSGENMLARNTDENAIIKTFEGFLRADEFPCVGAKSALQRGTLRSVVCWSLDSAWDDVRMHRELLRWADLYREENSLFRSLAFIFAGSPEFKEERFEQLMWDRLQSLADKDAWLSQPYDERVSADPESPHFSMSFGGEAFFVVGMHPCASRPARRTPWPVLIFNLHDQFEKLRDEGTYEKLRDSILERDEALSGSTNPMLARHGEQSEARQYSGRLIDDEWKCPFTDKRSKP